MCGIVGAVAQQEPVNQLLYDALSVLQHRGQDAAGIMTNDGQRVKLRKDNGLVRDVFRREHMLELTGAMGVGHVRYPTAGCDSTAEAQPFYVNSPFGIALAHNGNLTNAEDLKRELFESDRRHINTDSDSEILLNVFAHELDEVSGLKPTAKDVFAAVRRVHERCRGGYAVVVMLAGVGLLGFRDSHGIRPMCIGKAKAANGADNYLLASESVAMDSVDYDLIDDLTPGEAVFIDLDGNLTRQQCASDIQYRPCIFEFVYFARPDSKIDDISVYKARLRMGDKLAKKILRERPKHDIDVVMPIPDTSRVAAVQVAHGLGVKYREGFIKNRYVARTFIMPGQTQRRKSVRQKLNAIDLEFKGKNVMLVDDSIVRGTTSQEIIQMARDAGANKVYFASAAPPVRYPNVYGIDMPIATEFVAHDRDVEQIRQALGADWLVYQELDDLIRAVSKGNRNIKEFDTSCFSGSYCTGDVSAPYLEKLAAHRSDGKKDERRQQTTEVVDVHNVR